MNKPKKQLVYLPVKESGNYSIHWNKDKIFNHAIMKEGFFFTPEQLNQLLSDVIKDTLNTAAEDTETLLWQNNEDLEIVSNRVAYIMEDLKIKQSITNTFEESFNKFKV